MLFKIQKDLQQKNTWQEIQEVKCDIFYYKKLKKAYFKLPVFAKENRLTAPIKIFLLLAAVEKEDIAFACELIKTFDYDAIETTSAKLALGRFYATQNNRKTTLSYLLPLFDAQKLGELDLITLFTELLEMAMYQDCDRVIQFALKTYPDRLSWKIQALRYQIDVAHLYPKNKQFIVNNLNYLFVRCQSEVEYFYMGGCFFAAGYFDDAVKMFDLALQKFIFTEKINDHKQPFDSSLCLASMNEIIDVLAQQQITAFPVFGSLLGLVRDGKFMDYDKDADLGIFVESYEQVFNLVSKLCELDKFSAPCMIKEPKESHLWNVAIFDGVNGTAIDLFFFHKQPTHFETGIYTACGILKWEFMPFKLVPKELAGRTYLVPDNYEAHLTQLYENWREPVEVWDSLLNCPNLMQTSRNVTIFYGLIRFYEALTQNKIKKALNYYQTLTTRWGMRFSPEANDNLNKLMTSLKQKDL